MKASKHFLLEELTPPGHQSWVLLTDGLVDLLDEAHELLEAHYERDGVTFVMEVNTWKWGGKFKMRGWRPRVCATGAQNSQHKLGCAADFEAFTRTAGVRTEIPPDDIRALLRKWKAEGKLKHLGGMELGVGWVHIDSRNHDRLIEFSA